MFKRFINGGLSEGKGEEGWSRGREPSRGVDAACPTGALERSTGTGVVHSQAWPGELGGERGQRPHRGGSWQAESSSPGNGVVVGTQQPISQQWGDGHISPVQQMVGEGGVLRSDHHREGWAVPFSWNMGTQRE